MAEFSKKNGVNIKPKLIQRATSIINKFQPLGNLEKHINKHIAEGSGKSSPDYWIDFHVNNSWYKDLRHKHLHFSAKHETGLKPRFSFFSGKRQRYEFDG